MYIFRNTSYEFISMLLRYDQKLANFIYSKLNIPRRSFITTDLKFH